jgi:hypothetical protein
LGCFAVLAGVLVGLEAGVEAGAAAGAELGAAAGAEATAVGAVFNTARVCFLACPGGTFWVLLAAVEIAPFLACPAELFDLLVLGAAWTTLALEEPLVWLDVGAEVGFAACFLTWPGGTNVPDEPDDETEVPLAGLTLPLPTCPGGVPCGLP